MNDRITELMNEQIIQAINKSIIQTLINLGGLAQLARASALHAEGQRFESVILHTKPKGESEKQEAMKSFQLWTFSFALKKFFDILEEVKEETTEGTLLTRSGR
jgi:hypothetical protein